MALLYRRPTAPTPVSKKDEEKKEEEDEQMDSKK
jgi:hypothetical protein